MDNGKSAVHAFAQSLATGIRNAVCKTLVGLVATTLAYIAVPGISSAYSVERNAPEVTAISERQGALLTDILGRLAPQRPGITDLYFVGFAGYARQDVFLREMLASSLLLEEKFGAAGRSVLLVNNAATVRHFPLANRENLGTVLHGIGERMDPREDILFLFLTSHGRPNWLAVDFYPFQFQDLSARELRTILDWSGINWRIIVVSACYSGSFIDALADDNTLIITAARRDRTSFGCGHEYNFTYFGGAYFDVALRKTRSFTAAFRKARKAIGEREAAEGLRPSLPQMVMGKALAPKLEALARDLRRQSADQIADRSATANASDAAPE